MPETSPTSPGFTPSEAVEKNLGRARLEAAALLATDSPPEAIPCCPGQVSLPVKESSTWAGTHGGRSMATEP